MAHFAKPILVATTAATLLAGCGSDTQHKAQPLSAAEFTHRANAICRQAKKDAPPFPGKRSGSGLVTTTKLVTPYLQKTLKVESTALARLRGLAPPENRRTKTSALIAAQEARLFDLKQALQSAGSGDAGGFTTAIQNDQKQDGPRYLKAARDLGLFECARGL